MKTLQPSNSNMKATTGNTIRRSKISVDQFKGDTHYSGTRMSKENESFTI